MSYSHYERLSAMDARFLGLETPNAHMHVGSVSILDARPLTASHGGLDFERILGLVDAASSRIARLRQKVSFVPGVGPIWVDDHEFELEYHLRHTALPIPGDERRLKRLAGRIMSQQLDRHRALWELWLVEGVDGDRFAVISKVHCCLANGIPGGDLLTGLVSPNPDSASIAPPRWRPRAAPTARKLIRDELRRRADAPLEAFRAARMAFSRPGSLHDALKGLRATAAGASRASDTPLNRALGPHRRFDWTRLDLAEVKEVKSHLGGTVNDVVLACVSGAIRRFLLGRSIDADRVDFRALIPVSVRGEDGTGTPGSGVSNAVVRLPLDETDPRRCMRRLVETTSEIEGSKVGLGTDFLTHLADLAGPALTSRIVRAASRGLPTNVAVTDAAGSPGPVYLFGAPLLELYPVAPLTSNHALGIALFRYRGGLFWGFNSDWDLVPDLHELVEAVRAEFEALYRAVTGASAPVAAHRPVAVEARAMGAGAGR